MNCSVLFGNGSYDWSALAPPVWAAGLYVLLGALGAAGVLHFHSRRRSRDQASALHDSELRYRALVAATSEGEAAIRESEARYRLMAEHATDMIARLTPSGTFLYVSPSARVMLGYEPEELLKRESADLIHPDDLPTVRSRRLLMLRGDSNDALVFRMRRKDDSWVWIETTFTPLRGPDARVAELVAVLRDITERKEAEDRIAYQAYHDALTGLANRKLFEDRLNVALAHGRRQVTRGLPGVPAVLFIDLDHFKLINDTFGHPAGDRLLQIIAERIREALRSGDTVARFGGDEFTVLLPQVEQPEYVALVAQKILNAVNAPVSLEGQELYISASIGIAVHPENGATADALLRNADSAMYRAKETARNSFQLCSPAMNRRAEERLTMETSLHRALERQEFVLHYQPVVNTREHRVTGIETLLRWNHPEKGLVAPDDFMPIAEQSGLIVSIGEWILREACRQLRVWQAAGVAPSRLAVNVSAVQLERPDFPQLLGSILFQSGLSGDALELEITETSVLRDRQKSMRTLEALKASGVTITIDDFGTGYSSLTYLRSFPIDRVKIDRSFVRDVAEQPSDAAIVAAVITMAHALGIDVAAEGVETRDQVRVLTELRCNHLQGYFFSPGVDGNAMTSLLEANQRLFPRRADPPRPAVEH